MTEPRADDAVHQAFFGWSHDHQKLDLISYSFHGRPEGRSWRAKLEEHARLQPSSTEKPLNSLSYIDLEDGYVAVLRRVAQGHTSGRNNSHALIGPAAVIDVRVALGLRGWEGWRDSAPDESYMQTYHGSHIAGVAAGHAERLRAHIEQHERGLDIVVTRLLDNPDLPLSIIGCPNQLRLPMVWGLYAVAAKWLHESGHPRWWTFSTYEVHHDDSIRCLPDIVFLPERPLGAGTVNRTIVDLDVEPPASSNALLASQLLAAALRGTPSPVPKPVRETVPAGAGAAVRDASVPAHPNHFEQRPAGHDVAQQSTERRRTAALLGANQLRDFELALTELETSTHFPQDRQVLRRELDIAAMDTASRLVETMAPRELFDRLLKITYGPHLEDLNNNSNALEHATKTISLSQSDLLAMMLGRAAQKRNGPVRDTALDRSATAARLPAHAATDRATRRVRTKNRLLPYVPAAILLLALMFLLGYLAGRPEPAQPTSAPQVGGTPAGSAAPNSPKPTPTPNPAGDFTVQTTAEQGQIVFGFVAQGLTYIPQARCTSQEGVTWVCPHFWQQEQVDNKNQPQPKFVVFKVPQGEEGFLNQQAVEKKPVPKGKSWDGPAQP